MRLLVLFLVLLPALHAEDTIEAFGLRWQVPIAADWKFENGVLHLLVPRPSTAPRRPSQYALAETPPWQRVTIELEAKAELKAIRNRHNSLMLVYGWRDKDHFNYAHLSVDAAKEQPVHNGIFHVYGGDRVRISSDEGPATLKDGQWHRIKLAYDAGQGRVDVWVDDQTSPSLRAVDMSLGTGRVGIGSFFDMGEFRNVKITGDPAN